MSNKSYLLILIIIGTLIYSVPVNAKTQKVDLPSIPIYSLFVSGSVDLKQENSYIQLVLNTKDNHQYLVYSAGGPLDYERGSFSFIGRAEETRALDGVIPESLEVKVERATLSLDQVNYATTKEKLYVLSPEAEEIGIETYRDKLNQRQDQAKIEKINQYIKKKGLDWTAGKTSVSGFSYEERKKLVKSPSNSPQSSRPSNQDESQDVSNLPSHFDWRDKNGDNYTTRPRNQLKPNLCASCWAYAALGALESQIEINFDKPNKNPNLSEQDLLSCSKAGTCFGGEAWESLEYIKEHGVASESCFPYKGLDGEPCENKCDNWKDKGWSIDSYSELGITTVETIKQALLKGPLITTMSVYEDFRDYRGGIYEYTSGARIGSHDVVLVGYGEKDGRTYWIVKNSYGRVWGEQGWFRIYRGEVEIDEPPFYQVHSPKSPEPPEELKVSCSASPNPAEMNEEVTFISSVSGGTGSYSYEWLGSCKGKSKNCSTSFSSPGLYLAWIIVTSGTQEREADCRVTVTQKECNCSTWENQSCGGNDCFLNQMWQTRSCENPDCPESQCVDDPSCEEEECPDCWGKVDQCEDPPRCEQNCGAPAECDEKQPDFTWVSDNYCNYCDSFCNYDYDMGKPLSSYSSGDRCYYDCPVRCTSLGWEREDYNCESEPCPKFKEVNNKCYYNERCTGYGCKYSDSEPKPCPKASCTKSGWDISECEVCPDKDNDGYQANYCGGNDCCDIDAKVHPGATAWRSEKNNCGNYEYDCEGAENYLSKKGKCKCDNGEFVGEVGWRNAVLAPHIPKCGGKRKWFDGKSCSGGLPFLGPNCSGVKKTQQCGSKFEEKHLTKKGKCKCDNGEFTGDVGWKKGGFLAPRIPNCGGKRKYFTGRDEDGDGKECSENWPWGPSCDGRQITQSCR